MDPSEVPDVVVLRLPLYIRALSQLLDEGSTIVSSQELGNLLQMTPAQIRKDLSYFGRFGKQGRGYSVEFLRNELRQILGLDRQWSACLIGVGNLGQAIINYPGFRARGVQHRRGLRQRPGDGWHSGSRPGRATNVQAARPDRRWEYQYRRRRGPKPRGSGRDPTANRGRRARHSQLRAYGAQGADERSGQKHRPRVVSTIDDLLPARRGPRDYSEREVSGY